MSLIEAAIRGGAIALLLVLGGLNARDARRSFVNRYGVLFAVCAVAYLVESAPPLAGRHDGWLCAVRLLSISTPAVFWVWVKAQIDDPFVPSWRNWLPWLGLLALGAYAMWDDRSLPWHAVRVASLALVGLAIWHALAERSGDLVEGRRRLRLILAITAACYIAALEFISFAVAGNGGLGTTIGMELALVAYVGFAIALRVTYAPAAASAEIPVAAAVPPANLPAPDPEEARLLAALHQAMAIDKAYREEDCSVGMLADRLGIPEYRLRRLINQRLGHRNFTTYANGFRLADTTAALADPSQMRVPILTIALDAGFRSLGPFNRAFKAHTGVTPSEFRRLHLGRGAAETPEPGVPMPGASPIPKSANG